MVHAIIRRNTDLEVREAGHEQVRVLLRQGGHRQQQLREQALFECVGTVRMWMQMYIGTR